METLLLATGGLLALVGLACWLVILISSFKESAAQGLLCLFVPFYGIYWAFARFEHPRKVVVLVLWIGGSVLGPICIEGVKGLSRAHMTR